MFLFFVRIKEDVHRGETTNVMYAGRIAEVGHHGDHVKTVHEEVFINYANLSIILGLKIL